MIYLIARFGLKKLGQECVVLGGSLKASPGCAGGCATPRSPWDPCTLLHAACCGRRPDFMCLPALRAAWTAAGGTNSRGNRDGLVIAAATHPQTLQRWLLLIRVDPGTVGSRREWDGFRNLEGS